MMKDLAGFLFAGMDTTSKVVCSAMLQLKRNPDILTKVRSEVSDKILKGAKAKDANLVDLITPETLDECEQLGYLAKESLRKHPSAAMTLGYETLEQVTLKCGITIPKDETLVMGILPLHFNSSIWREPDKFVLDRFNPESEWYLTQDGKP